MDASRYRNRQKWVQAVLLWDMASSEDFDTTALRDFQSRLDYWRWQDRPSFAAQSSYQTLSHGYTIDFAFQKVFAPQKTIADGGIAAAQLQRLDSNSTAAFERMLAFSTAASLQKSLALQRLFGEMGHSGDQLAVFKRNFQAASIVFAFDAVGKIGSRSTLEVAQEAQGNGQTFPRPIACIEGFSGSTLDSINRVQNGIFGLPLLESGTPTNCSAVARPLSGYLNVLALRTPLTADQAMGQAVLIGNAVSFSYSVPLDD